MSSNNNNETSGMNVFKNLFDKGKTNEKNQQKVKNLKSDSRYSSSNKNNDGNYFFI
jgi:hypothetical protein